MRITFAGPFGPSPFLEVGEQDCLFQIRDPLHAGGTPATRGHASATIRVRTGRRAARVQL